MRRFLAILTGLALVVAGCGSDGDDEVGAGSGSGTRTVLVEMRDIDFEPASVSVAKGETVRFEFTNKGKLVHDAFIGDADAQADHERQMRELDESHGHPGDEEDAITVDPGEKGELVHTFDEAGDLIIGCHEAGHYDAGMRIRVTVA